MANIITSDHILPIDESFQVTAGPGAGKTHWLISHINNVLTHSTKIGLSRKIACITYTNVGVDTIKSRLNSGNDLIDVCTIHTFLYDNIVKPYIYLVAEEYKFPQDKFTLIDDSNFKSIQFAYKFFPKTYVSKNYIKALNKATWQYEDHAYTDYMPSYLKQDKDDTKSKGKQSSANDPGYKKFKHCLWQQGYISFDDIFYFSYILLSNYPILYKLISARYPYIFIDEFQDTVPFVLDTLVQLSKEGVVIGVVGDIAQSIYDFSGVEVEEIQKFYIPGYENNEYEIRGNRRSTKQIIELLNTIRPDFSQECLNKSEGDVPELLVGDVIKCYQKSIEKCGTDNIKTLSYTNRTVNFMRQVLNSTLHQEIDTIIKLDDKATNLLKIDFDSNYDRQRYIKSLIKAVELAQMDDMTNAWYNLNCIDSNRYKTIMILQYLLLNYKDYKDGTLMDFYNTITDKLSIKLTKIVGKEIKNTYNNTKYADVALCVSNGDSNIPYKTIHKSKGDEFDNVFIILDKVSDLNFLTSPNLINNQNHRLYYVAASRAKKRLFITVPKLDAKYKKLLAGMPINITYI